jgi:hypothetical protein
MVGTAQRRSIKQEEKRTGEIHSMNKFNDSDIWAAFGVTKPIRRAKAPRKPSKVKRCPAKAVTSPESQEQALEPRFSINWADIGVWRYFKAVDEPDEALDVSHIEGWQESLWP